MAILIECPKCHYRQKDESERYEKNGKVQPCKKCGELLSKYSGKNYWIELYVDGKRRREKIGPSKDLARTVHQKRLVERAENKLLDRKKVNNVRFSDFVKDYEEWSKANNKSYEVNKKYYIAKVKDHFNSMFLRDVNSWQVEKFKSDRLKETGKYEVNRELATLKHMLSKAVEWGKLSTNPSRTVKKFKESKGRVRFLMPDEFQKLYLQLPSPLNEMSRVAVLSGLRKENILGLKRTYVSFENQMLNIPDPETKNSEFLKIPMCQPLSDLLKTEIEKHPESEYVFCQPDGKRYRNINFDQFRKAVVGAGLEEGLHFHDLRHTHASHLVMSGTDLATVKELLGHKDIAMTMRYAHLAPDHKRKAVETIGVIFGMDTTVDTKAEKALKKVIEINR